MKAYRILNRMKPWQRWWVANLPGRAGVDWGYTTVEAEAVVLTPYWQRRFRRDAERCGDEAHFISQP